MRKYRVCVQLLTFLSVLVQFVELDIQKKAEGSDLDEFNAHRFLEKVQETKTVKELREQLKAIDLDFNKRMAMLEYCLFRYKKSVSDFVSKPQGDNSKEIEKASGSSHQRKQEKTRNLIFFPPLAMLEAVQKALDEASRAAAEAQAAADDAKAKAAAAKAAADEAARSAAAAAARAKEADQSAKEAAAAAAAAKDAAEKAAARAAEAAGSFRKTHTQKKKKKAKKEKKNHQKKIRHF